MSVATVTPVQTTVPTVVNLGDLVLTSTGVYRWNGTSDMPGLATMGISLFSGNVPTIQTDADTVAPAVLENTLNLKDPRISVRKDAENRPVTWVGPWRAEFAGDANGWTGWFRTKKEAVAEVAARIAIAEWHENGGVVNSQP